MARGFKDVLALEGGWQAWLDLGERAHAHLAEVPG